MQFTITITRTQLGDGPFDNLIYNLGLDYPIDGRTVAVKLTICQVELIDAT